MISAPLWKLLAFPFAIAAGQLLFKQVAGRVARFHGMEWLIAVATEPRMWLAVTLYGGATILWVNILAGVPLARAYPFVALAFVLVPVAGALFFGETLTVRDVLGGTLIVAGVLVTAGI